MKMRVVAILILCLSFHTTAVFAHPKPAGMSDGDHQQLHFNEEVQEQLRRGDREREQIRKKQLHQQNEINRLRGKAKG